MEFVLSTDQFETLKTSLNSYKEEALSFLNVVHRIGEDNIFSILNIFKQDVQTFSLDNELKVSFNTKLSLSQLASLYEFFLLCQAGGSFWLFDVKKDKFTAMVSSLTQQISNSV